jgi:hypothetical protein
MRGATLARHAGAQTRARCSARAGFVSADGESASSATRYYSTQLPNFENARAQLDRDFLSISVLARLTARYCRRSISTSSLHAHGTTTTRRSA